MTYKELVTRIKTPNEFLGVKYAPDWQHVALLAVVELCKSNDDTYKMISSLEILEAIEKALK